MEPTLHAVRPSAVSGLFYPAEAAQLRDVVDGLLAAAVAPAADHAPKAIIVPHAGYRYSGPVAATAYAALAPFAERIRRVVLVGPSHRVYFSGLALPRAEAFVTPLGRVRIETTAATALPSITRSAAAHAEEHSLEVQLPFLQRVLGDFALVPLVTGDIPSAGVADALDALWGGPETVVVVSSDLSHYLPYGDAHRIDRATAQRIVDLGSTPLEPELACGATGVNGLVAVARRRGLRPVLLDLRSSGDTCGPRDQVVGYGAFAFYEEARHDA
jgi:AmmeMemoRadiSam system protein B